MIDLRAPGFVIVDNVGQLPAATTGWVTFAGVFVMMRKDVADMLKS